MQDLAARLVAKYFPESREELILGGERVTQLAQEHGTPLFVYDPAVLDVKFDALRRSLPSRFSIYYSIKANPYAPVVRHLLNRGCGLEVASGGEFQKALQAGCPAERILFAGPGKSEGELEEALGQGIGEIHVESLTEAKRISAICRRLQRRARIAIRVNPTGEAEGGAMRMGGRPAPFGIDEETLPDVLDVVANDPALEVTGLHVFAGTQILSAQTLVAQYRHGLAMARGMAARLGGPLKTLDFGGGLGIPYFAHEQELDLDDLERELKTLAGEIENDSAFEGTRFVVEPGRFLAGEAGVYVARVTDIKVSRGKRFLIVNGGMNHHLAASGNLGQTIKRNYPVALLNKLDRAAEGTVDVVGPLCTPLDTLARGVALPQAEIGDLFGIFQSGAYGLSASPVGFLSHRQPVEVLLAGRREQVASVASSARALSGQEIPAKP